MANGEEKKGRAKGEKGKLAGTKQETRAVIRGHFRPIFEAIASSGIGGPSYW